MTAITQAFAEAKKSNPSLQFGTFVKTYKPNMTALPVSSPTAAPSTTVSAPSSTPMSAADLQKEISQYSKLGISDIQKMQLSSNPEFRKAFLESTYGSAAANLPEYQQLMQKDQQRQQMGEQVGSFAAQTSNAMLALEEALREKGQVNNQKLGQSELYGKAGINNFFTLNQSLNERGQEMNDRYTNFLDQINKYGTYRKNEFEVLSSSYESVMNEYNSAKEQMDSVLENVQKHNEALDLAQQELSIWKEQQTFLRSLQPSAEDIATWREKGYEYVNGEYIPEGSFDAIFGTVGNPSDKYFGECGYFSNRATNASDIGKRVGDSWQSKIATADTVVKGKTGVEADPYSFNFKSGNTLYIPMGQYGHTAVITSYDPETGNINVVERNKNLDGKTTSGVYNVFDLQNQYSEWGVANTSWRSDLAKKMEGFGGGGSTSGLSKTAQQVMDNPSLLGNYTSTEKGKILTELAEAGVELKEVATPEQIKLLNQLNDDVRNEPLYKQVIEIQNGYQNVTLGASMNNPQGDLSIVNGYAKLLDPTGVVRPEEFKTVEEAQSFFQKMQVAPKKFMSGDRLVPEVRKDFSEAAKKLFIAKTESFNELIDNKYVPTAEYSGVPLNLIQNLKVPSPDEILDGSQTGQIQVKAPDGQIYLMSPEDAQLAVQEGGTIIK